MIQDLEKMLLTLALVWPLLLLVTLAFPRLRAAGSHLIVVAAFPALLLSLLTPSGLEYSLDWLLLGVSFGIDEISSRFLLFGALLWTAGSLLIRKRANLIFRVSFLMTLLGSFTVLLARDIPTFFFGYAMMSLATFGLIFDSASVGSRHAARVYLVFAIIGEMVLLSALIMVAQNSGTLEIENIADRHPDDLLMTLLLIGFGIKSGLPLLHLALPPVYAALPAAAAVPVAGALLHLGLYGWLRFLPLEFPLEMIGWSQVFVICGIAAIGYGSSVGLLQKNPRALLAYSSISQMGLMLLLVAALLAQPDQRELITSVILLFALHHALAKGLLFYGLETFRRAHWSLWLPALSLAGAPLSAGALAKSAVKLQVPALPGEWAALVAMLLPFASVGTTLLMARFLYLAGDSEDEARASVASQWSRAGWWLLLVTVMGLPWLMSSMQTLTINLWSALWPLLLGSVLALLVFRLRDRFTALPSVPPGDLLVPLEKLLLRMLPHEKHHHDHHPAELKVIMHPPAHAGILSRAESAISRWAAAMLLLSLAVVGLYLLL